MKGLKKYERWNENIDTSPAICILPLLSHVTKTEHKLGFYVNSYIVKNVHLKDIVPLLNIPTQPSHFCEKLKLFLSKK